MSDCDSYDSDDTAVLAIPMRGDLDTVLDAVTGAFAVQRPQAPGLDSTHGVSDHVLARAPQYSFGGKGVPREDAVRLVRGWVGVVVSADE